MATCTYACRDCNSQHQTTPSTHWCIDCDEPFCTDCREIHSVYKYTQNHKIILIADNKLLQTAVIDNQHNCVVHNEKCELYCVKHEIPICNKCVSDHGKCTDSEILVLEEVSRNIKTSESFVDLEQSLGELFDITIQIQKDREYNLNKLTDQKKMIGEQIVQFKQQVIQHVNKLEEEFTKEVCDFCGPIRSIVSSLQDKATEIKQMKSIMKNTKKYASDLKAFQSMRQIQANITEYETHLLSSIDDEFHKKINIESALDAKIQDILSISTFGSIKFEANPSINIDLNRRKDRQAKMMVTAVKHSINDVKLELQQQLSLDWDTSIGCCITRNGELLLTNYEKDNGQLLAVNTDGKVEYTIQLEEACNAFDVACLDDHKVAISTGNLGNTHGISIVDLTERKVTKFINLPGSTCGIAYDGKSLICCVEEQDLHVISFTDYRISTIPNTLLSYLSYVATHADKIFFTNIDKNSVTCCSYTGTLMWEFRDVCILRFPQGITVDTNGIIFVLGLESSNMVTISPDGKQCNNILTRRDDLYKPRAIFFDNIRKQLLLTNPSYVAYVYKVSYSK